QLDALVVSHAHIDHIGRVPLLVKRGFAGPIFTHRASAELFGVMLEDAASLQESDAARANKYRRDSEPEVQPLYDKDDVRDAARLLEPLSYDVETEILPGVTLRLRDAGHILGSAIVELWADGKKLVFSGDLGQKGTPVLRDLVQVKDADLLL